MSIADIPKDVLLQAAHGDIQAFEEVYKATSGFVYNVAFRIAGNKEDAQEITQDVFLKIYKNLKNFEFRSAFKTWVYRVTVNTALNSRKKTARGLNQQVEYNENMLSAEADSRSDPLADFMEKQYRKKIIAGLLKELKPQQRAYIVLREMQGLSYEEIAQTLKVNINTVRTRLKRAREILLKRGGYNEL